MKMGRQLAIKFSEEKEREFVEFLNKNRAVLIYPWSKNKKINIIKELPKAGPFYWFYKIWNKNFPINPDFIEVKKEYLYRTNGHKYAIGTIGQPFIDVIRNDDKSVGRIYWEKYFTTNNPNYNVEEFEKWYNEVVNWIKKNTKKIEGVYTG